MVKISNSYRKLLRAHVQQLSRRRRRPIVHNLPCAKNFFFTVLGGKTNNSIEWGETQPRLINFQRPRLWTKIQKREDFSAWCRRCRGNSTSLISAWITRRVPEEKFRPVKYNPRSCAPRIGYALRISYSICPPWENRISDLSPEIQKIPGRFLLSLPPPLSLSLSFSPHYAHLSRYFILFFSPPSSLKMAGTTQPRHLHS